MSSIHVYLIKKIFPNSRKGKKELGIWWHSSFGLSLMHLSAETPTTPTPEKHGAYVGAIGDWTFLCGPWGGGLGQFRQLSSLKYWKETGID